MIENGIERVSEEELDVLLVYGDPKYYGMFGFRVEVAESYIPPYPLQYPFGWQGMALRDHGPGRSTIEIVCVASLCDPALW